MGRLSRSHFVNNSNAKKVAANEATLAANSAVLAKSIRFTQSWNPAAVAAGAVGTSTFTVPGAALGDVVHVAFNQALPTHLLSLRAHVSAADTVQVVLTNGDASSRDLATGTVFLLVVKP